MTTIGEPKNLKEAFESSNASEWELAMEEEYESLFSQRHMRVGFVAERPQGGEMQVGVSHEEGFQQCGDSV